MDRFSAIKECIRIALEQARLRWFSLRRDRFAEIGENSFVLPPSNVADKRKIFLGDHVNIDGDNILYVTGGKFIMKDYSGAAVGLTVITGNHVVGVGEFIKDRGNGNLKEKDIIVEENVWLAANVTLLSGSYIGRESIIGAGCVIRGQKVPPYAIVVGNPAKVVGFKFSPEDVIEHEKLRYEENDRLPIELLNQNYKKYFLDRLDSIKRTTNLKC